MIIMNYTGDRINFGIAVEKAKAFTLRRALISFTILLCSG